MVDGTIAHSNIDPEDWYDDDDYVERSMTEVPLISDPDDLELPAPFVVVVQPASTGAETEADDRAD